MEALVRDKGAAMPQSAVREAPGPMLGPRAPEVLSFNLAQSLSSALNCSPVSDLYSQEGG
ncbi:hypothetical protein HaLaN_19054, partial [Haematococcus lacustris]